MLRVEIWNFGKIDFWPKINANSLEDQWLSGNFKEIIHHTDDMQMKV